MRRYQQRRLRGECRVSWLIALAGWAATGLLVSAAYFLIMRPDLRLWNGTRTHGNPARRAVALSFDDGPHPLWAPLLADTLHRHGAHGTFFLVGFEAQRYPEITTRLVRDGHQVGNHSLSHPYPNLTVMPKKQIAYEITTADHILRQLTGQPIGDFRPPGGGVNDAIVATLKAHHLHMAWWSANVGDWSSPTSAVTVDRLNTALRPGVIVLMHQRGNSVAALETFLADRPKEDYTYTTVDALMRY